LQKEIEEEAEKMDLEWYDYLGTFFLSFTDNFADTNARSAIILPGFATIKAEIFYALGGARCTEDSCESEKFSNGESYCVWRSETGASGLRGKILTHTMWSPADAACVPRYPPGTGCGGCGGTGDNDACDEPEAWAVGNCIFEPMSGGEKFARGSYDTIFDLFPATRFNLIPYSAALWSVAVCSAAGLAFLACFPATYATEVGKEVGKFGLYELIVELSLAIFAKIYAETAT
jgi:hypothetical protein